MKNILNIFFFFIFIFYNSLVNAECDFNSSDHIKELSNPKYIKLITITTVETKKFNKNFARIITSEGLSIPHNLKNKRFKAKIKIQYNFGTCNYEGKIRQHGDWKNHVMLRNGRPLRSIDVLMSSGNINNAVKYKLLIPETRYNKHEVLGSLILKKFGFIVPETFQVQININGDKNLMLFQEKAAKELLERNLKREGPIFEGEEDLIWFQKKYNTFELENISLSRLINKNWFNKGENYEKITLKAYRKLQNAYLHYIKYYFDSFKVIKPNFDKTKLFKDYYLILEAMNGTHALRPHNRKYYFNSFTNYFEPIYYDGDFQLNKEIKSNVNYLYSKKDKEKIKILISKLKNKDFLQKLKSEFNDRILNSNDDFFYECINQIIINLDKIDSLIDNKTAIYSSNRISKNDRDKYYENHKKNAFNQLIIERLYKKNSQYELTIKSILANKKFNKSISSYDLGEILSKNFYQEQRTVLIPENKIDLASDANIPKLEKLRFNNGVILYSNDIIMEIIYNNKIINIKQNNLDDWILFSNINLKNWKINFNGIKLQKQKKEFFKMNSYGITGCMNFYNVSFDKSKIYSRNGMCEDSINLINSIGVIDLIDIKNASADGLDADFSEIKINKLKVEHALNDCADFSKGNYNISFVDLYGCNDKGLSVGEESILNLNKGSVRKSNIGIASKDSSLTSIQNVIIKNVDTCYSSYNKKQEFHGSLLKVQNSKCENYVKKTYNDKVSKIKIN